ncbi:MAG: GTP cyclohydrolase I FolE [Gammaproteobacteria bacterium]|nr:GTP cyclohydrolase I FolE [Gammaproteobacteria bacterium]
METYFKKIIETLGEDPNREGLKNTPKRAAQAFAFLTQGYKQSVTDIVNGALFPSDNDELVLVKNIELYSLCEHHLLPFIGKCHVGYLPQGKILGLSKIARLVDMHARRLQVQENLTKEIAETIYDITGAKGVGVIIEAQHLCMMMRGVEKQNSTMTTAVTLGLIRDDAGLRSEFLSLVRN